MIRDELAAAALKLLGATGTAGVGVGVGVGVTLGFGVTVGVGVGVGVAVGVGVGVGVAVGTGVGVGVGLPVPAGITNKVMLCGGTTTATLLPFTLTSLDRVIEFALVSCHTCAVLPIN